MPDAPPALSPDQMFTPPDATPAGTAPDQMFTSPDTSTDIAANIGRDFQQAAEGARQRQVSDMARQFGLGPQQYHSPDEADEAQAKLAAYTAQNPVSGRLIQAAFGGENAVTALPRAAITLAAPTYGNAVSQDLATQRPVQGVAGTAGQIIGGTALLPAQIAAGGAPAMMGEAVVQGTGEARGQVAQERAAGAPVSGLEEAGRALLGGGLSAAQMGLTMGGAKVGEAALSNVLPGIGNRVLQTVGAEGGAVTGAETGQAISNAATGKPLTAGMAQTAVQASPMALFPFLAWHAARPSANTPSGEAEEPENVPLNPEESATAALQKHQGGLVDFLTSWNTGRKAAGTAQALFETRAGPAVSQLLRETDQGAKTDITTQPGQLAQDQFEKTGHAYGDHADRLLHDLNADATAAATRAGVDTSTFNPYYMGRASKPKPGVDDQASKDFLVSKFGGSEGYLKSRTQPDTASYLKALDEAGREPASTNAFENQAIKMAEIHRSAAIGETLRVMAKNGDAIELNPDNPALLANQDIKTWSMPKGWKSTAPLTGATGKNYIVPDGVYRAWDNVLNRSSSSLVGRWNSLKQLRYIGDTMLAKRAITGYAETALPSSSPNKLANLVTGFKASLHPEILNDPDNAALKTEFVKAAKEGGFSNGTWQLGPGQRGTLAEGLGKLFTPGTRMEGAAQLLTALPRASNKYVVAPLRTAAMLNLADEVNAHPEWSPETAAAYRRSGIDTINRLVGSTHGPTALPPILDKVASIVSPYWRWKTAGARQLAAAVPELAKGNPGPAVRALLGTIMVRAIGNTIAQAIATKVNTGSVQLPNNLNDLLLAYRTGAKNPDGSEVRASLVDSFLPVISAGLEAAHKEVGTALQGYIDPEIERIAQSMTGRDYTGHPMTPGQRAENLFGGLMYSQGFKNAQGQLSGSATVENLLGPTRLLPKTAERSSATNVLEDALGQSVRAEENPEAADKWQRWSQLADTPEDFQKNKQQIISEMRDEPTVGPAALRSALKHWTQPHDIASLANNGGLSGGDLLAAWNVAGPDEQAKLAPVIANRLSDKKWDGMSRHDIDDWRQLANGVRAWSQSQRR